eukprot:12505335-Alexandrium_andersonii.AAC.1
MPVSAGWRSRAARRTPWPSLVRPHKWSSSWSVGKPLASSQRAQKARVSRRARGPRKEPVLSS